ncbi:MAG TPA: hypothetical protein VJ808_04105 [Gemmatimonadales bacterium]|nr:hypothetical protein [Gemmatimonadales bacterium]
MLPRFTSVRVAAMITLAQVAGACMSWQTQEASPEQLLAENPPDQVRVTRADGSTVLIVKPLISGDSLTGTLPGSAPDSGRPLSLPLADVRSVEVRRVNAGRTALLVAGLGLTAVAVVAAASEEARPAPTPHNSTTSCPLVYSWTGTEWRLDSGTFGGAIAPSLARTDLDNLIHAVPERGILRLRVANELAETDYLDAVSVLAVDHAPGFTLAPDGQGRLHTVGALNAPRVARDFRGADALQRVRAPDGWNWESNPTGRDTAHAEDIRDGLELVFAHPGTTQARLVLDGNNTPWAAHLIQELVAAHGEGAQAWYDSLATHPPMARKLGAMLAEEAFLGVSVWSEGRWQHQGYIWEAGPEIAKRQVFPLDLSKVAGDSIRVRLESAPSFWLIDHVALDASAPIAYEAHEIFADSAIDANGIDLRDRLRATDASYFVMENGAAAEMQFRVPAVPAGIARSYFVRSHGWYRIHNQREDGAPKRRVLARVFTESHGASRVAVGRFNDALLVMERERQ